MLVILVTSKSKAAEEFIKGHATAYCLKGITASGQEVRTGLCAMNKTVVKENNLMGKTVELYQRLPDGTVGKLIGTYEVADTGCKKNVVDVWCEDLTKCQEFMNLVYLDGCRGKIYYKVVEEKNNELEFK